MNLTCFSAWLRRLAWIGLVLAALDAGAAQPAIADGQHPESSPTWLKVRASLFGTRDIQAADGLLDLQTPDRAEDAAVVPVSVKTSFPQTPARRVDKLYLVIDNNPSPISAIFQFGPRAGRADIDTRVRIDGYTFVRAIAETSDGKLYMSTRFVKASGGCSAPPGKDHEAALASLGRMRLRLDPPATPGQPALAQLMISHPNDSGMVMDQATRQFTAPHFVRTVEIKYGSQTVLSADLDFSISENPNIRFYVTSDGSQPLTAEVTDSHGLRFNSQLPAAASAAPPAAPAPAAGASAASISRAAPATDPSPVALAPGVYLVPGTGGEATPGNRGRIGNAGFIVGTDGVLAIDTGTSFRHGAALLAAIGTITDKPVKLALVTHAQPEFLFGALAFRERGVPLRMQAAAASLMAARCAQCLARLRTELGEDEMRGTAMFEPDQRFASGAPVEGIGRAVEVLYFGPSSGPGDIAVLDGGSGVLFAGGLVENARVPEVRDALAEGPRGHPLAGWHAGLAALRDLPIRVVVPAHGSPGDKRLIDQTDDYLAQLEQGVRGAMEHGISLGDAPAAAELPAFAAWDRYEPHQRRNVGALYLALERAQLDALATP